MVFGPVQCIVRRDIAAAGPLTPGAVIVDRHALHHRARAVIGIRIVRHLLAAVSDQEGLGLQRSAHASAVAVCVLAARGGVGFGELGPHQAAGRVR